MLLNVSPFPLVVLKKKQGLRETIARMRAIRRVVQVRKPDIVIPFMHSMFIPMAFALIGMKIPIIASEHIVPRHYKKKKREYFLLLLSSFFVKKITVLSENVEKLYPYFVRRKMIVMPNPVSITLQNIEENKPSSSRKTILNVGRLEEQKDQKTLIRAFATLADIYPDWDIKIFGEGSLKPFLQDLINRHSLQNRVFLMDTTKNIAEEYRKADFFAMPSQYESFGLVTAEAMSYGIPAVGFKECPGTNEIIIHGINGILVSKQKKEKVNAFADGLESLIADQKKRTTLGRKAPQTIEKFTLPIIIEQWETLIKEQTSDKI